MRGGEIEVKKSYRKIGADTTYGSLIVTATGLSGVSLRWVCTLSLTEVVYP
jgi:hypothetical protein